MELVRHGPPPTHAMWAFSVNPVYCRAPWLFDVGWASLWPLYAAQMAVKRCGFSLCMSVCEG